MQCQAALFDFNGVILWDRQWHEEAWDDLAELVRGQKLTPEEHNLYVHGRPPGETLNFILGPDADPEEAAKLLDRKEDLYQKICLKNANFGLSPGAEELFNSLKDAGIKQTIATSSRIINVDFYYEHLGLARWFPMDKIVYDDLTFPGKPEPDLYLMAAAKLGVDIQKCVVVEDARSGVVAANKAGAGKVFVLGDEASAEHFKDLKVDKFVRTLGDVQVAEFS